MNVIIGQLYRKRTVKRMNGQIIDWTDEANGGDIIRKGQVVNQSRVDLEIKIQADKELAGHAEELQVSTPNAPDRTVNPTKMEDLEKKVDGMESKLDLILKALNK